MKDVARQVAATVLLYLAFSVPALGEGLVPVELITDPHAPWCFRLTTISVHAADGEPIPMEPGEQVEFDPTFTKMSVGEAMKRLDLLGRAEHLSLDQEDVVTRYKEFECLSSIVAPHDPGGMARIKALHNMMVRYEESGGDPLELGYSVPMSRVSGFHAAPRVPAYDLIDQEFSATSAAFLEDSFREEFERAIPDREVGRIFSHESPGQPAFDEWFYVSLMKSILHSGFATPEFVSWIYDKCVEHMHEQLTDKDFRPFLLLEDLRLLAHAGVLEHAQVRRLLNLAAPALFLAPDDHRDQVVVLLGEITNLSPFDPRDGVRLLALLEEAQRLDPNWSHRTKQITRAVMERFDIEALYPDGQVPEIASPYKQRRARGRQRGGATSTPPPVVHMRLSKVRFQPQGEPLVLEVATHPIGSATWQVFRCGTEQSGGTVSARYASGEVNWCFHSGASIELRERLRLNTDQPAYRRMLKTRVYVKAWENMWDPADVPTFDLHVLDLSLEPFEEGGWGRSSILQLLAEAVPDDAPLAAAAFRWIRDRPDEDLADMLVAICKRYDDLDNRTAIKAANLLVLRNELQVFEEMIPDLLEMQSCMPTPLLDVFHAMADDDRIAPETKRGWAVEIVRKHLNGPVGGWKAMAAMKVVTHLSGESLGFQPNKSAQANLAVFHKAQQWAWSK